MRKKVLALSAVIFCALACFALTACGSDYAEYNLKQLTIKNAVLGDIVIDIGQMTSEEASLYDSVIEMYGKKVIVKEKTIEFSGTVLSLYSPAKYTLNGENVTFENSALSGVFNDVKLSGGKFSFGISEGGNGFSFDYYTGAAGNNGGNGGNNNDNGGNNGDNGGNGQVLTAPQNLRAEDGIIRWDAVAEASEYELNINGASVKSYISSYGGILDTGSYAVKVRALIGNTYTPYSQTLSFSCIVPPLNLKFSKGELTWSQSLLNYGYTVRINGALYETPSASLNIMNIENLPVGQLTVQVKSNGNGSAIIDSRYSDPIYVTKYRDKPVIDYNASLSAVKESDTESPALFGAAAFDAFGQSLPVEVIRTGGQKTGGSLVSYRLTAKDSVGNTVTQDIRDIAVYGAPVISYEKPEAFKSSDTVTAGMLSAVARDSFGRELTVSVSLSSGSFAPGQIVSYRLRATDELGNTAEVYANSIKVYGNPVIRYTAKQAVKVSDTLNSELFGVTAEDSFGVALTADFDIVSGTKTAGQIMAFRITATDKLGQISTAEIGQVGVYGLPAISCGQPKSAVKISDTLNAALFSASAQDSFGNPLALTAGYSGTKSAGQSISVVLSAVDAAGNYAEYNLSKVDVYGEPVLTYNALTAIKITDDPHSAALYNAAGKDSFNQSLTVNISVSGTVTAGGSLNIFLSVMDIAGNSVARTIAGLKVYDTPVFTYNSAKDKMRLDDQIAAELFTVVSKDSFGSVLAVTASYLGSLSAGSKITLVYTAADAAGNTGRLEIPNVSVYGAPVISGFSDKRHTAGFGIADLLENITALDSFGASLSVYIYSGAAQYTPDLPGAYTVSFRTDDALGNFKTGQYTITVDAFSGKGNQEQPFLIENQAQMKLVRLYQASDFKLMTDIDLDGYGWTPVGNASYPYTGIFDGNGKTIRNLNTHLGTQYYDYGLFGTMSGTVKNLNILNFDITKLKTNTAGGIAANLAGGQIYNCSVDVRGSLSGLTYLGGIAGNVKGVSAVMNCYVTGQYYVISNNNNTSYTGDIIGYSSGTLSLINNYSVCASGAQRGGSSIYYHANIIGGFTVAAGTDNSFINNFFDTTVNELFKEQNPSLFGSAGYISTVWANSTSGTFYAVNCKGYIKADMQNAALFNEFNPRFWIFEENQYPKLKLFDLSGVFQGAGTPSDPFKIGDIYGLDLMRYFPDRYFILENDITAPDFNFVPAPVFNGGFNGNGKTVSISIAAKNYAGIFTELTGYVYGLNLNVFNLGGQFTGAVASKLNGGVISELNITIQNFSGVNGGGAVYNLLSGKISGCSVIINNFMPYSGRGGIAVVMDGGVIENCRAGGNTSSEATGTQYAGGIVARLQGGTVRNCISELNIYCYTSSTGASQAFAGGIAAVMTGGVISACVSKGAVSINFSTSFDYGYGYAGGIAGLFTNGVIENCYTLSPVRSLQWAYYRLGGIAGFIEVSGGAAAITNCYADNTVTADTHVSYYKGGLIGYAKGGTLENCLYNTQNSNMASATGGATADFTLADSKGVTAAEMLIKSSYTGFGEFTSAEDLSVNPGNVWVFNADEKPVLYWETL